MRSSPEQNEGPAWLRAVDEVFAALAHPARRQILLAIHLRGGSAAAGVIASRFEHAWPTTTRHLSVLATAGLLTRRRAGKSVVYELDYARLAVLDAWRAWLKPPPAPGG